MLLNGENKIETQNVCIKDLHSSSLTAMFEFCLSKLQKKKKKKQEREEAKRILAQLLLHFHMLRLFQNILYFWHNISQTATKIQGCCRGAVRMVSLKIFYLMIQLYI